MVVLHTISPAVMGLPNPARNLDRVAMAILGLYGGQDCVAVLLGPRYQHRLQILIALKKRRC